MQQIRMHAHTKSVHYMVSLNPEYVCLYVARPGRVFQSIRHTARISAFFSGWWALFRDRIHSVESPAFRGRSTTMERAGFGESGTTLNRTLLKTLNNRYSQ